eukprot:scaffold55338_cov32-Tisochrysis_lutea.AAC.3
MCQCAHHQPVDLGRVRQLDLAHPPVALGRCVDKAGLVVERVVHFRHLARDWGVHVAGRLDGLDCAHRTILFHCRAHLKSGADSTRHGPRLCAVHKGPSRERM